MSEREAAIRIGEALAQLRRERGLSQAEAGARIGMTSQGWSLYESGRRAGLFRPDVQKRLMQALDATPEDLALIAGNAGSVPLASPAPNGMSSKRREFEPTRAAITAAASTVRFRMGTDDMAPWAFSDTVIEYDPDTQPRTGHGCVAELVNGGRLVGLLAELNDQTLVVTDPKGQSASLSRQNIRRIGRVIARYDQD